MISRENICSQHSHCLSCPLSVCITGKDCRELTFAEIKQYGGYEMFIDGKWMEEPELNAYVAMLHIEINELKDEIKILREALSRGVEEEYD